MIKKRDFLDLIKDRKTCYEFGDKKINDSDISNIIEAGRWAPSFSNIQPWRFVIVKNKNNIADLMRNVSYGAFHFNPPLIIAVVFPKEVFMGDGRGIKDNKIGQIDGNLSLAMASMNMILEAENLGINSAILTPNPLKTKKILCLDKGDEVPLIIGFGYERKNAFRKKRTRKTIKELVYFEKFRKK